MRLQHGLRERSDRAGGAEEPGMTGCAAKRPGILVVHLADQHPSAPGIEFRRRRAGTPGARRIERQRLRGDERGHSPELRASAAA